MNEAVIVSGVRTAIGNFGGALQDVPAVKLGSIVIQGAMKKAGLKPKGDTTFAPESLKNEGQIELEKKYYNWDNSLQGVQVDEVIMGNVIQAGQGQNPARQAMIHAGVPKETNAFTINKVCASGLKAIALGAQSIMLGEAEVVVAGGMEQDELGLLSHQRARAAIKNGFFKEEIVPVVIPQKKGEPIIFDTDERPMDTSLEKMGKLPTAFKPGGTVTAGNASGINDAAAAVVLMSTDMAKTLNLEPMGKIRSYAAGGVDPAYMGLGPIPAVRKALKKAGGSLNDIGLIELNEAFASQAIACLRELQLDMEKTNVNGR